MTTALVPSSGRHAGSFRCAWFAALVLACLASGCSPRMSTVRLRVLTADRQPVSGISVCVPEAAVFLENVEELQTDGRDGVVVATDPSGYARLLRVRRAGNGDRQLRMSIIAAGLHSSYQQVTLSYRVGDLPESCLVTATLKSVQMPPPRGPEVPGAVIWKVGTWTTPN